MRKAELRLSAQQTTNNCGEKQFIIYKSMQYRWESEETADPQIDDINYHLSLEDAIKATESIHLDLGFTPQVDQIKINYTDINENIDFREDFELEDLDKHKKFYGESDTVFWGETNIGNKLDPNQIIVFYKHHRYMNYAYTIESIRFVYQTNIKYEADLRNYDDSTLATYCQLFDSIEDLAESFENSNCTPFNKLNHGIKITEDFLQENKHPEYI